MPQLDSDPLGQAATGGSLPLDRTEGSSYGYVASPKLSPAQVAHARRLVDEKQLTVQEIADLVKCSRAMLYRHLGQEKVPTVG